MAREKRKLYTTILFVGEGLTEKIFIQYLRGIYSEGKAKVTVKSANGKGPKNVIEDAISCFKQDGYDYCCAALDTDLEWTLPLIKKAKSKKVILIGSTPCIEGVLLDILGKKAPKTSQKCKDAFNALAFKGKETLVDKAILERLFPREVLDAQRERVITLNKIIRCLEGGVVNVINEEKMS